MLPFVEVKTGTGDAAGCVRCGVISDAAPVPYEEALRALDAAVAAWTGGVNANVSFSGGEPFDLPSLPDLVARAVAAGAARVRIVTSGAALGVAGNAGGCQSAGVRHMRVVLLGSAGLHDALAGSPGLYAAAMEGVAAWRDAATLGRDRTFLSALVPVCEHNVGDLPSAVADAIAAGAREVVLRVPSSMDDPWSMRWIGSACDTGTVNRARVTIEGLPATALDGYAEHAALLGGESR